MRYALKYKEWPGNLRGEVRRLEGVNRQVLVFVLILVKSHLCEGWFAGLWVNVFFCRAALRPTKRSSFRLNLAIGHGRGGWVLSFLAEKRGKRP